MENFHPLVCEPILVRTALKRFKAGAVVTILRLRVNDNVATMKLEDFHGALRKNDASISGVGKFGKMV